MKEGLGKTVPPGRKREALLDAPPGFAGGGLEPAHLLALVADVWPAWVTPAILAPGATLELGPF